MRYALLFFAAGNHPARRASVRWTVLISTLIVAIAGMFCGGSASWAQTDPVGQGELQQAAVPFYRLYGPMQIDHFYTANVDEMVNAISHLGYVEEGIAGYIYPDQVSGTVPFYRLYNPAQTDHLYTTNVAERDNAMSHLGYLNEGIAGYIYPDQVSGTVPFYRLYNPAQADHFYTTNVAERDNAMSHLGYLNEGIAGYVRTVPIG